MSFGYYSDAYEAELLSFIKPGEKLNVTMGLFHRNVYYATNPAELSAVWGVPYGLHLTRLNINSRMIENSVFSQADLSIGDKIDIIGGVRLQQMLPFRYDASGGPSYPSQGRQVYTDTYEFEKLYVIPSFAFLYAFQKRHIVKLLYGEALRNPPLGIIADVLFSTADDETFDYPQLIPSKIRTYEINYNGNFGSKFTAHVSVFRNDLENLISQYFLNLTDTTTVYYSSNKGKLRTNGIEISLMYMPLKNLSMKFSLAYQQSDDRTEGIEKVAVAYSPNLLGYGQISYSFLKHWSVYLNGRYVSSMFPEYDYESQSRLGQETPAFTLLILNHEIKNKCRLTKKYASHLPQIEGNSESLIQVFLNIIMNGVQSIKDSGDIIIKTQRQADQVLIRIKDTGEGISKENLKKIFDPFFTTKDPGKGVGLDLSICYKTIREHSGTIHYQSELGKGTEVLITLPLKQRKKKE